MPQGRWIGRRPGLLPRSRRARDEISRTFGVGPAFFAALASGRRPEQLLPRGLETNPSG